MMDKVTRRVVEGEHILYNSINNIPMLSSPPPTSTCTQAVLQFIMYVLSRYYVLSNT